MTRILTILNFLGVLALAVLCAVQWQTNSRLGHRANLLDETCRKQTADLSDKDKTLKENAADLDDLHQRLSISESGLKDAQGKLAADAAEHVKLIAERDQLKAALDKWVATGADWDAALKKLTAERDGAVQKYNDLVVKYNSVVKDLNAATAKQ